MGLTAGPENPPWLPRPRTSGTGAQVSRLTPISELTVLISAIPSAPPARAARAGGRMSVTLGVSLTSTGSSAVSITHSVIIRTYSGTCPTAAPMPRSLIPCGQPKLSSNPSAPVSFTLRTISCHASRLDSTISDTTTAWFG